MHASLALIFFLLLLLLLIDVSRIEKQVLPSSLVADYMYIYINLISKFFQKSGTF